MTTDFLKQIAHNCPQNKTRLKTLSDNASTLTNSQLVYVQIKSNQLIKQSNNRTIKHGQLSKLQFAIQLLACQSIAYRRYPVAPCIDRSIIFHIITYILYGIPVYILVSCIITPLYLNLTLETAAATSVP